MNRNRVILTKHPGTIAKKTRDSDKIPGVDEQKLRDSNKKT